jgi:hypothetical protein
MPKVASRSPAGNGGKSGAPFTKWRLATGMRVERPGSASSGVGNLVSIFVLLAFRYAVCDLLIWPVRRLPEGAAA